MKINLDIIYKNYLDDNCKEKCIINSNINETIELNYEDEINLHNNQIFNVINF